MDVGYEDDDDDDGDKTKPFQPGFASTPGRNGEEIPMKTMQKEKSGLPSYAETAFAGRNVTDEETEKRLQNLRLNPITGLLDITYTPNIENPLSEEEKQKLIQKVRNFIKARYPNADFSKLVIRFSYKKPMDIVLVGPKGGETKIVLDNGSGFQKSFLNMTYVKKALGESYEELMRIENQSLYDERQKLIMNQNQLKNLDVEIEKLNQAQKN